MIGLHAPGPHRRWPAPTPLGWRWLAALAVAGLLGALTAGVVRADEGAGWERFTPDSRGDRPAALARAEVVDLAAAVFGPELAPYVANIARCESSNRPAARSAGWDRVYGRYDYRGLLQIEQGLWGPVALELYGSDDLTDPRINLLIAREIVRQQGWRAWPVCGR